MSRADPAEFARDYKIQLSRMEMSWQPCSSKPDGRANPPPGLRARHSAPPPDTLRASTISHVAIAEQRQYNVHIHIDPQRMQLTLFAIISLLSTKCSS